MSAKASILEKSSNLTASGGMGELAGPAGMAALQKLERSSDSSDLAERLKALREAVSGRIVLTTSFGVEDQLLTHVIATSNIAIDLVTLDTGRLFPSTYRLWEETEARYRRRIHSIHPDSAALAAYVADAGINGFYFSPGARLSCCHVRKVEPLSRALEGAEAWVTGLRADQSQSRGLASISAWDDVRQLIKFSPLFDRTREEIVRSCEDLKVPVNPLHQEGFLSIGCEPCTRAVKPGEPERSGRWWWETGGQSECGLHIVGGGALVGGKAS